MADKKNMDLQTFVYYSATQKAFREKYFRRPALLAKDFEIPASELASIKKLDLASLSAELKAIDAGIGRLGTRLSTCHDSHGSHGSGTHSSGTHSNSCKAPARGIIDRAITRIGAIR